MVNQTVSIPSEPEKSHFLWRNIIEYKDPNENQLEKFENAVNQKEKMRQDQQKTKKDLMVQPNELTDDQFKNQCKIWLRIARKRGIDVQKLIGDEYKQVKLDDKDEKRHEIMDGLDDFYRPETASVSDHQPFAQGN